MKSLSPTPETKMLEEFYAALNRNDIPAVVAFLHPEIERIEPGSEPAASTYRGHTEVAPHFTRARDTWAEGSCGVERIIPADGKFLVLVHVRVRLKDRSDWIEGRIADGFVFRDGLIAYFRTFVERELGLDWAGVGGD